MIYYATLDSSNNVTSVAMAGDEHAALVATLGVTTITQAQYVQIRSAGGPCQLVAGAVTVLATPLATLQAQAAIQVDAAAETARLQFVTPGAAQQVVYTTKASEAAAFLAAYPTDTAAAGATATAWPMLNAEVGITASDLFGVATVINTLAVQWTSIAANIEALRLGAKKAIAAATTATEIATATTITWPAPSS